MEELMRKYAKVLLETCLKIEENQPLFLNFNIERIDFARIVMDVAFELGVKDLYYDPQDPYLKHEALKHLEVEELKDLSFWNRDIWNVYAKKGAAFLMLTSETPGLMNDIDPNKLKEITKYSYETMKEFDELRDQSKLAWCIAAIPTQAWAKEIFKESEDPVKDLWNQIFEICHIKEENPTKIWEHKISKLKERANKLNEYQFTQLVYKSNNGTDLTIGLPQNHIWASASEWIDNKKEVLVNFPTEEVFTSPTRDSANGVVYSSKPLAYQDVMMNNFHIKFKDGKVVEYHAEEGEDTLSKMITICDNSDYLGEVALVPYDSPISNTNKIFLETLLDENATCHIALGDSFPECLEGGIKISKEKLLEEYKLNKCDSHIDFMIGSKDLSIKGITKEGREVPIFEDGNFTKEFE